MAAGSADRNSTGILRVGDGRGFVVGGATEDEERYILTAAHCLPHLPPAHPGSYIEERTYRKLLGRLGDEEGETWAECLFVDPVSDIAILGSPDRHALNEEAEWYEELVNSVTPFLIADAELHGQVQLCSLDGRWFECQMERVADGPIWLEQAVEPIQPGMSGSPVCRKDGWAVGILSVSAGEPDEACYEGGPNPVLMRSLPAWFLRKLDRPITPCLWCGLVAIHGDTRECVRALRERASELEGDRAAEQGG